MFITPAYAQAATGAASSFAGLFQFAPLVLMGLVFYFLLLRPQQQQAKELKSKQNTLSRGDKIITAGGIVATIKKATDGVAEVEVEIAPNVTVTILRSTISQITASAKADKV